MKTKFRVVKLIHGDNSESYYIQKRTRFFWIGPKIWETYFSDGWHDPEWRYFRILGTPYGTLESANEKIEEIKKKYLQEKVIKTEYYYN